MEREELLYLKKRLQEEKEKRDKIRNLLQQDNIKELISLAEISPDLFVKEDYELLRQILKNFKITKTNGIYICVDAYYYGLEEDINNSDLIFEKLDSRIYDKRLYKDIENGKEILGCTDNNDCQYYSNRVYDKIFNKENIVLNPYNTRKDKNGYEKVRQEFFENAIKYGQTKSKKILLNKYPRL